MNRLSFFIVVLVLLTVGSSALGQTQVRVSTEVQPCLEEGTPGRPTLKQRGSVSETSPTEGGRVNQRLLEKEKCKQEVSAEDSIRNQKPISIKFEGLHAFSEADMVKAIGERLSELQKTQMPSSEVLAKAVAHIKEMLEARGYFNATVATRNDEAETLVFLIDEGRRLSLAEVRFEGSKIFSSNELTSRLGEHAYYAKMLEGYDSDIFDYCTRDLLDFIRSEGYLKATFSEPAKAVDARGLVLTIQVDEGLLYRLGEIKFEGAEAVAPEKVRAMLNLRQGDPASGMNIGKWLYEDVKRVYGEIGYIEYTAEPVPEFKVANGAKEGVVDFVVYIEEGRQFRLHSVKFQGSSLAERELRGLSRIRAGDVFNQRLFEESIDDLNKSGRFELIDKDKDTDFRTDEEMALLDIVIKVNKKNYDPRKHTK
jgi:outer membrane protein insertion porin family